MSQGHIGKAATVKDVMDFLCFELWKRRYTSAGKCRFFLVFRFLKTENPEKSNLVFIVFFNSRFLENCKFKLFLEFSLTKSAVLST